MKYFLIGIFLSTLVSADPYTYSCEINGEYSFDNQGKLVPHNLKIYLGKKFNVERKTGVVLGGGVGNSTYPTKKVLDFGGKEQAYKLIWISDDVVGTNGGKNIGYLSIEEYDEKRLKPFSMMIASEVLTGLCQ